MSDRDAALAITSGSSDMQRIMNLAWEYLLPRIGKNALSPDDKALKLLTDKLIWDTDMNVSIGPRSLEQLKGKVL